MGKTFRYILPLLSIPLVISCGSNSNKNANQEDNDPTTIQRNNEANEECVVSVRCQNSSVSLTSTGTNWTRTLDQTVTTGSSCSFFFRANLGYNLPSDIFSIEKKEGGEKITDYTYEVINEKVNKLTFTPTADVYVSVVADTTCATATINATSGVTAGFKYNGSLTYVDWGDGTVNQKTSHTYNVTQECAITIAGNISSVSFGDNNPTANAYSGNAAISKISLRNTIKYIPTGAFSNLTNLSELDIPASVETIAPRAFVKCPALNQINIDEKNEKFITSNNQNIIDKDENVLVYSSSNAPLPEYITEIAESAYEGTNVGSLVLPKDVVEIGENAFKDCTKLKSLDLSKLTNVPQMNGEHIFDNVSSEFKIVISPTLYNKGITTDTTWTNYLHFIEWLPITFTSTHLDITCDADYPYPGTAISFKVKRKTGFTDYSFPESDFKAIIDDGSTDKSLVNITVDKTKGEGSFTFTPRAECIALSISADIFKITFKSGDGYFKTAQSDTIVGYTSLNAIPAPSETPKKDSDAYNDYIFSEWDPLLVEATENATYTATYSPKAKESFKVGWYLNKNDTDPIDTEFVSRFTLPSHEETYHPSDDMHHYRFVEWREIDTDSPIGYLTHDTNYYAYCEVDDQLSIHFVGTNVVEKLSGRSEFYDPVGYGESCGYEFEATTGSLLDATLTIAYVHNVEGVPKYDWNSENGKLAINSPIKDDIEITLEVL